MQTKKRLELLRKESEMVIVSRNWRDNAAIFFHLRLHPSQELLGKETQKKTIQFLHQDFDVCSKCTDCGKRFHVFDFVLIVTSSSVNFFSGWSSRGLQVFAQPFFVSVSVFGECRAFFSLEKAVALSPFFFYFLHLFVFFALFFWKFLDRVFLNVSSLKAACLFLNLSNFTFSFLLFPG